jgi:geranylgeranyl diphosphate synthase type I
MMELSEELEKRREIVNTELQKALDIGDNPTLKRAMCHYPSAGGKRLRPVLAMLMGDVISGKGEGTIPFGLTLELIHNFTLVHDDIMDNDEVRRGIDSVHKAFGMPVAIIAGDSLFSLAFEILAKTDIEDSKLRGLLEDTAITVRVIAEGQQMDMEFESRVDVSESEYLEMIGKKTACLFDLSSKGGALIAGGTDEQVEMASEYGRFLGMGFQIRDDIIGAVGDEGTIGKPVGSDIRNGKRTLIAVKALETLEGNEKKRFMEIFGNGSASDDEIREAVSQLESSGAIRYAQGTARRYAEKAHESLKIFKESSEKEILKGLADFVVAREV